MSVLQPIIDMVNKTIPTITSQNVNIRAKKLLAIQMNDLVQLNRDVNGEILSQQEVDEFVVGLNLSIDGIASEFDTPEFIELSYAVAEMMYKTIHVLQTNFPRASTKSIIDSVISESNVTFE